MINNVILNIFQYAINHYLQLIPNSSKYLKQLQDKTIQVTVTGLPITIYILASIKGLHISTHYSGSIDAHIIGPPLTLLRLAQGDFTVFHDKTIQIIGDMRIIIQYQRLIEGLEFDWEEHLSRYFGDFLAHQVFIQTKFLQNNSNQFSQTIQENTCLFLQDELYLLPSKAENNYLLDAIDQLYLDTERLEARISHLFKEIC